MSLFIRIAPACASLLRIAIYTAVFISRDIDLPPMGAGRPPKISRKNSAQLKEIMRKLQEKSAGRYEVTSKMLYAAWKGKRGASLKTVSPALRRRSFRPLQGITKKKRIPQINLRDLIHFQAFPHFMGFMRLYSILRLMCGARARGRGGGLKSRLI